jgi:DNA-binding transcriptional MerR regulator
MAASNYKIGQIASRLGFTVRTLRPYDGIGLLQPSHRTSTGQRLYTDREITRLQKIVALRRMGFSLDHVRTILCGDTTQAYAVLDAQASQLRAQIARQQDVLRRVERVLVTPTKADPAFTGPDGDTVEQQSATLRQALILEMQRGTDPKDPQVQALVQQLENLWKSFFRSRSRMENFGLQSFEVVLKNGGLDEVKQTVRGMSNLSDCLWRARALVPRAGKP